MLTINSKVLYAMLAKAKSMTTATLQASYNTVLLEAKDDALSAKATNTLASFAGTEPCKVSQPFAACVQPTLLQAVLEGKNSDAEISYVGTQLKIKCDGVSATLATIKAVDFLYPQSVPIDNKPVDASGIKGLLQFCASDDSWKSSVTFIGDYAFSTDGIIVVRKKLGVSFSESVGIKESLLKSADFCFVPNARFGYDSRRLCFGVGGASVSMLRDASSNGEAVIKMFSEPIMAEVVFNKRELLTALNSIARVAPDEMRCTVSVADVSTVSCDSLLAQVKHSVETPAHNGVSEFDVSAQRFQKAVSYLPGADKVTIGFTKRFIILDNDIILSLLGGWK